MYGLQQKQPSTMLSTSACPPGLGTTTARGRHGEQTGKRCTCLVCKPPAEAMPEIRCWNGPSCRHLRHGYCKYHHPAEHLSPPLDGTDETYHECCDRTEDTLQSLTEALAEASNRLSKLEETSQAYQLWKQELTQQMAAYVTLPQELQFLRQKLEKNSINASTAKLKADIKSEIGQDLANLSARLTKSLGVPDTLMDELKQMRCGLAAVKKHQSRQDERLSEDIDKVANDMAKLNSNAATLACFTKLETQHENLRNTLAPLQDTVNALHTDLMARISHLEAAATHKEASREEKEHHDKYEQPQVSLSEPSRDLIKEEFLAETSKLNQLIDIQTQKLDDTVANIVTRIKTHETDTRKNTAGIESRLQSLGGIPKKIEQQQSMITELKTQVGDKDQHKVQRQELQTVQEQLQRLHEEYRGRLKDLQDEYKLQHADVNSKLEPLAHYEHNIIAQQKINQRYHDDLQEIRKVLSSLALGSESTYNAKGKGTQRRAK